MKRIKAFFVFAVFFFASSALWAAELTVTWVAPTQREDGTTLAAADIAAFILYERTAAGAHVELARFSSGTTGKAAAFIGTKTLVMRTVDKNGLESSDSNAVMVTFSQPRALQFRVYMTVP